MPRIIVPLSAALVLLVAAPAGADEVLFLNGDRLSGTILSASGGKLVIKTEAAGEVTIDLTKVSTFSADAPVRLKVGQTPPRESSISAGAPGEVQTAPVPGAAPVPIPITDIAAINPLRPAWKGSLAVNGLFTTGNSETQQIGGTARLAKRWEHDRLSMGAEYSYGRQKDPDTGDDITTVDYGNVFIKYDHFFTEKLYVYGQIKAERDGLAALNFRVTPSAGVGYQWFQGETFNLSTEAGLAWVYEDFESTGSRQFFAPRLAYAVDWTPVKPLTLYHNLEYLPAFDNLAGDYLLNIDAGLRVGVWKGFFTDFKVELRYDSDPAPGAEGRGHSLHRRRGLAVLTEGG